jgi:hypothetical protein
MDNIIILLNDEILTNTNITINKASTLSILCTNLNDILLYKLNNTDYYTEYIPLNESKSIIIDNTAYTYYIRIDFDLSKENQYIFNINTKLNKENNTPDIILNITL